jgi:hypothetical protein
MYMLAGRAAGGDNFADIVAIGTLFFPLAIFRLLRLPTAF